MYISIDWIKDFVDLPELSPSELASKFTLATAEVENVNLIGEFLEKIQVVQIVKIERHPNADKLNLVTFRLSDTQTLQVVCGASNVQIGLKVPYAPLGTVLPSGLLLEAKKIRGVLSEGMLCSEDELGMASERSSGIMELPAETPVGETMLKYFNASKDIVFDIDNKSLTHRPDLWGHFGIAREFSAIFSRPLKNNFNDEWEKNLLSSIPRNEKSIVTVSLDENSCGLAYYGLSLNNITVCESPKWLKDRLEAVGLRPINNIVDISNYVMLELGIPLHIFDRRKITGNIKIKALLEEEKFTTLDEVERILMPGDTVVSDNERTLVIAGIMGGAHSGVDHSTQDIFIEVANWEAVSVRKTSTRLGLRTDSSQRYEKSLDGQLLKRTLLRTLELIFELCPASKVVGPLEYDGIALGPLTPLSIDTSLEKINGVLGLSLDHAEVVSIFKALDFSVTGTGNHFTVLVPSFRSTKDIEYECDLIEEIGRIVGFDHIIPKAPLWAIAPIRLTPEQLLERRMKDFLIFHSRAYEVMTYPLVGSSFYEKCLWNGDRCHQIINALSEEQGQMRASLIPSLLQVASLNQKHSSEFNLFELGRVYKKDDSTFSYEEAHLGVVMFHKERSCFQGMVNNIERLNNSLKLPHEIKRFSHRVPGDILPADWPGLHPLERLDVFVMGKNIGSVFTIHPILLKKLKIKGFLSFAILNLSSFHSRPLKNNIKYTHLPKFPSSLFDCTIIVDKNTDLDEILVHLKKIKMKEFIHCKLVDIFPLNEGQKAITLRSTFFDPQRTLDGAFLSMAQTKIVQLLEKHGFPLKS